MERPESLENLQSLVRTARSLLPFGGATKPALDCGSPEVTRLDMNGFSGVVEYQPEEYTITLLAGTPVREIVSVLRGNGQYLPFTPPFADSGSTIGGAVASGLSGYGRHRYGGIRDFIIGVRFVDGLGDLVRGGGNVVKNAAGFDFPSSWWAAWVASVSFTK